MKIKIVFTYVFLFVVLKSAIFVDFYMYFMQSPALQYKSSDVLAEFIFFGFLVLFALILPQEFKKPSDILLHIQFIFPIVPMLVLYSHFEIDHGYMYFVILCFLMMIGIVNIKTGNGKGYTQKLMNISPFVYSIIFTFLGFLTIVLVLATGVASYFSLDFDKVYEFREDIADAIPGIMGYLIAITTKTLLPALAVMGLLLRKYYFTVLAIAAGVILFGLTSHKAIMFYPIVSVLIYVYFSRVSIYYVPLVVAFGVAIAIILIESMEGGEWLYILFVDRLLMIPAAINISFYDWFSQDGNPYIFWADSKISMGAVGDPYSIHSTKLIGLHYFGSEQIIANTGWVGSGIAQAGYAGVLIYAIILGYILRFIDILANWHGAIFVTSIGLSPMLAPMLSSDLPNGLLTHGVLVLLLLLYFLRVQR